MIQRRFSPILLVLVLGSPALVAPGCGREPAAGGREAAPAAAPGFRGRILADPIPRPAFTLLDTSGEPFGFLEETRGKVALLFFGYTHCPDVCPIHMGNIAAVLDDLGYERRREVRVVFVSTDPERDTPERIRSWLDRFDPTFVGLRGTRAEVDSIQRALGLPPSVVSARAADGTYAVGHAAQVLAFSPDGPARVAYPFGTRQADWAHDLPLLIAGGTPSGGG